MYIFERMTSFFVFDMKTCLLVFMSKKNMSSCQMEENLLGGQVSVVPLGQKKADKSITCPLRLRGR